MKTSELTGEALDWAVAKCEQQPLYWNAAGSCFYMGDGEPNWMGMRGDNEYCPSTNWAESGPIIEREGITITPYSIHNGVIKAWKAGRDWPVPHFPFYWGSTPLVAAMRCYVASVLGDEVELPSVVEKIGL